MAAYTPQSGHYGLLGMRERTRLLGGELKVQSAPGSGTRVCISVPLPPDSGAHTAGGMNGGEMA